MSDAEKLSADQIRVLSITDEEIEIHGQRYVITKVLFKIGTGALEFPVFLDRRCVSDENIVLVARHHLNVQGQRLADATASWKLSEEDYQKVVVQSQPSHPAPGSIQLTV